MPAVRPGAARDRRATTPTTGEGDPIALRGITGPQNGIGRSLTIVVPGTPDKRLTPNAARRTDWRVKADVSRELRHRAMIAALGARNTVGGGPLFAGPVVLTERIWWGRGERRTDLSAVPLLCKAIEDGLTDAVIWRDDAQVVRLVVEDHRRDPAGVGYVELRIEEATA